MPGRRLEYVDALRGVAVLGVVAVHSWQKIDLKGGLLPYPLRTLAGVGQYGVQLFFLVSAVTLFLSQDVRRNEERPLLGFFVRRFCRIVPMYYFSAIIYFLWTYVHPTPGSPPWSLRHVLIGLLFVASFTNAWHPRWIASIPPGSWSVAVEMNFYLLIPWLHARVCTLLRAVALAASATVFSVGINALATNELVLRWLHDRCGAPLLIGNTQWEGWFLYFWLPNQFPVFCFGIIVYFLVRPGASAHSPRAAAILLIAAVFGVAAVPFLVPATWPGHLFASGFLACLVLSLRSYPFSLLVNPLTCAIGTVSFSIFLLHFIVLDWLDDLRSYILGDAISVWPTFQWVALFLAAVIVTATLAHVTYKTIEQPGIALGRSILAAISAAKKVEASG